MGFNTPSVVLHSVHFPNMERQAAGRFTDFCTPRKLAMEIFFSSGW